MTRINASIANNFIKSAQGIGVLTDHGFEGRELWVYARAAAMIVEERPHLFNTIAEPFADLADQDATVLPFFIRAAEAFEATSLQP